VALASERLGVTAKLDLVEVKPGGDGQPPELSPVEYKKGAPKAGEDGQPEIWEADRMQLGLQMLLLRDNGYRCDTGFIYYRETRQRVPLALTEELEAWVLDNVSQARRVGFGELPPPLDHSWKCPRCSHVGHCLPDETRYLAEALGGGEGLSDYAPAAQMELPMQVAGVDVDRLSGGPFMSWPEIKLRPMKPGEDVRRLLTPGDDTKALYLQSPHMYVSKKGETLVVKEKEAPVGEFRLMDLHHLALFGAIQLSASAVQALCEKDIPITYFTLGGWFYGMTRGHSLTNVFTRIEQFRQAGDAELRLSHARLFVHGKLRNQRTLLMRNHIAPPREVLQRLKFAAQAALGAGSVTELMGIEGAGALAYFSHFQGMLKPRGNEDLEEGRAAPSSKQGLSFDFNSRNRRPPRDPVNAMLSLGYSLLARDCTLAAYACGFDPYVGFLHQPRFGRPALALDVMEEFRAIIVDSIVVSLINNGRVNEGDFVRAGDSVSLSANGRRAFFMAYEQRMAATVNHPVFDYKLSYRRALELQFRLLARVLGGEIQQYVPFTTR
jgi:CRISPR-associated protein Cas1